MDANDLVTKAAAELLAAMNPTVIGRGIVVTVTANGLAVEIRVHLAVRPARKGRAAERESAIEAVRTTGRRLTGKEIRRTLVRGGGGYGLPEWEGLVRREVPRLFPEPDEWDRRKEPAA